MRLTSEYVRRTPAEAGWYGTFRIVVDGLDAGSFPPGSRLVVWCSTVLDADGDSNARVVDRFTGQVVVEPIDRGEIDVNGRWTIVMRSTYPALHANDGPEGAYVVRPDGSTERIDVVLAVDPVRLAKEASVARTHLRDPAVPDGAMVPLVPWPGGIDAATMRGARRRGRLADGAGDVGGAPVDQLWSAVAALGRRLGVDVFDPAGTAIASSATTAEVTVREDRSIVPGGYRLTIGDGVELAAGDADGVRHGLVTLAQWCAAGLPDRAGVDDAPAMRFRGVHLDLARRWYEPAVVERLIDLAAWRKLDRVHLHLTDDEAWRVPVEGFPALTDVGGTRGHGLAIPALFGTGPEPYGRGYTATEIGAWVDRARDLGVVLVPEVDVPGHCHAALVALPHLRDPDDTSAARSVQGFVDNALVPGHPATMPFLEAVFGSLARLFPHSPWLHIGGDEVPEGAWDGSPLAAAYAERHGITGRRALETRFHRDLIAMIRDTTGRDVAMWEEVALGGVEPAGYAVAWASPESGPRLAAAGHDVVVAPGQAYYLDMAASRDWDTPGLTWAGTVPLEVTCEFDPRAGWLPGTSDRLAGVQACIWSEKVSGLDVLDTMAFPRLDAVAERGWSGRIHGGEASLAARAAPLPRFTT